MTEVHQNRGSLKTKKIEVRIKCQGRTKGDDFHIHNWFHFGFQSRFIISVLCPSNQAYLITVVSYDAHNNNIPSLYLIMWVQLHEF